MVCPYLKSALHQNEYKQAYVWSSGSWYNLCDLSINKTFFLSWIIWNMLVGGPEHFDACWTELFFVTKLKNNG